QAVAISDKTKSRSGEMSNRNVILGTVVATAIVLVVLGLNEADYLERGYDFSGSFAGRTPRVVHIDFPTWLKAAHGLIGLAAFSTLTFLALMRRAAVPFAWVTLLVAMVVGIYDVYQYGTLGSPTSIKTVSLVLLLSMLATHWRRTGALQ